MIETYEEINRKLKNSVNVCVQFYKNNPEKLKEMIAKQRRGDISLIETNRKNRLIQWKNRLHEIQKQYSSRDFLEGEIGTIDDIDQMDGITNLALLALCANRITKFPKAKNQENKRKDRTKSNFYTIKNEAMSSLLASILVLSEASEEYQEFFSYGNRIDEKGNSTLTIDLPYFGQISLHYGSNDIKELIINTAKAKARSILERKCELGQIEKEEMEKIEISNDTILPQYTGRLYEYDAGFPLENEIDLDYYRQEIGIKNKLPEDINKEDIKNFYCYPGLNDREKNYLAIKSGFSKRQMEELLLWMDPLSDINAQRKGLNAIDARKLGKECMKEISAEERKSVNATIARRRENDKNIYRG